MKKRVHTAAEGIAVGTPLGVAVVGIADGTMLGVVVLIVSL